jgi:hypothetical protein
MDKFDDKKVSRKTSIMQMLKESRSMNENPKKRDTS